MLLISVPSSSFTKCFVEISLINFIFSNVDQLFLQTHWKVVFLYLIHMLFIHNIILQLIFICNTVFIHSTAFLTTESEMKTLFSMFLKTIALSIVQVSFKKQFLFSIKYFCMGFVLFLLSSVLLSGNQFSFQERSAIYWKTPESFFFHLKHHNSTLVHQLN